MDHKAIAAILSGVVMLCAVSIGQTHRVRLDSLSTLDDPDVSIEILQSDPPKPVKLPPGDRVNRRFLKEFYSWKMTDNPDIVIMAERTAGGELLYIDKNLNSDLTDDGKPLFFPFDRNTVSFSIISPFDPKQKTPILLSRIFNYKSVTNSMPDSVKQKFVDPIGNLNPNFAAMIGALKGGVNFKGSYGDFYFTDRISVRRGTLSLGEIPYTIGLFDYSNNGVFDDDDDVVIIDSTASGSLEYNASGKVHLLNDVFSLGNSVVRVSSVDRYGRWIDIEQTNDPATEHFLEKLDSAALNGAGRSTLTNSIWNIRGATLTGDSVSLDSYRGKYILLNFWGEWCSPCIGEIPLLVSANQKYSDSIFQCISFIQVHDLEKAKEVIRTSGIAWPQIFLSSENKEKFDIRLFPTNILILPAGNECIILHGAVSGAFFDRYMQ